MKRLLVVFTCLFGLWAAGSAQRFAFVDTEYILKNIPAYESAQDQLDKSSSKWQKEVEAKMKEVETLYKNYQTEMVFLSDEMKVKRENEIVSLEKNANELKKKYFGPEGELFKKRESLIKPIQDEIFNAIKQLCSNKGYDAIYDKASSMNLLYSNPDLDVSDEVLKIMGYSSK